MVVTGYFRGTTGQGMDGAAERSERLGDRPLGGAEDGMSGERGEEEDHVEDH